MTVYVIRTHAPGDPSRAVWLLFDPRECVRGVPGGTYLDALHAWECSYGPASRVVRFSGVLDPDAASDVMGAQRLLSRVKEL